MGYKLGIDIGGTFTDFALIDEETGTKTIQKQLTTPDDPSVCVLEGIRTLLSLLKVPMDQVNTLVHGTTLVTRAVIEWKGAVSGGFGDGPVDATFKTIKKITRTKSKFLQFPINAITSVTEAQGEVTVKLEGKGQTVIGQGADTDVIIAIAKAYINALNKMEFKKQKLVGM